MYRLYIIIGMNKMDTLILFENYEQYLTKFTKQEYPEAFEGYYAKAEPILKAIDEKYASFDGKKAEFCQEISQLICEQALSRKQHSQFKNQKQELKWQMDMNLFMVSFLFPTIMECRNEYYKELCSELEKSWAKTFRRNKIKAATYETVNSGFQKKAFGLF